MVAHSCLALLGAAPPTCPLPAACDTFKCTPVSDQRSMEQSCYKCGQTVEEGRPFCPHCMAPQIRVLVAEPVTAPATFAEPSPQSAALPASETVPVLAVPVGWSRAFKPCALAALVASVLMGLHLNPLVAMVSMGFLAVIFYRQGGPTAKISAADGARLGALSGLLGFAISSLLGALAVLVLHQGPEFQKALSDVIEQASKRTTDPQTLEMFDRLKTPQGHEFLLLLLLVTGFFMAVILAAIGGSLCAAVLNRRNKP